VLAKHCAGGCEIVRLAWCNHGTQLGPQPLGGADQGTRYHAIGAGDDGRRSDERLGDAQAVTNAVPQRERLAV
jgi:hypothetical protein